MVIHHVKRDPNDLRSFGPRLEIEVGPPLYRSATGIISPGSESTKGKKRFYKLPALVDTGAARTTLTPEAIRTIGLPQVDVAKIARAGGIDETSVYVAAIQFPRHKLATIEVIEVMSCALPEQPIQCLLGRDVLARWIFTYNGPASEWKIEEEDVAPWVVPPDEIDM